MHITLAVQGKLKDSSLKALYEEYKKRLEWKIILQEDTELPPSPFLITLDERGDLLTSEDFAALLQEIQIHHQGKVTFVIGDADGISPVIKEKATKSVSFGRLTWPHLMVRILLMEQLYRAQQILKNHPYHRGAS
jgi:23S rRNA (pseudouridine1915-N3)-methyltransferase